MSADFGFTIDVPVVRRWENIDGVRTSLEACVSLLFKEVSRSQTLAMVAGELLENAVKYGHWTASVEVFRVRVWGAIGAQAHIEVSNPVSAPEAAQPVFETLASLSGAAPAAMYQARMLEVAASGTPVSRLGLLRIAYEGECRLAASLVGGILTVTATIPGAA